jgi:hypothetical protein
MFLPLDLAGTVDQIPEPGHQSTDVAPYWEKLDNPPVLVIEATAITFALG